MLQEFHSIDQNKRLTFSFNVYELIEPGQHTLLWKMTRNAG